ncbi:DELTA-actitoxin-Ate1a-like [Carcharodon carcharias]|uniref:DELTA-actitoxin-Ate1a-like n=1 Tax=Carcharodon carcharias TaxID=13397 RepID=UPI001B7DACB3|nr:DELTA-actitoxin-Ate1a-like [Carcharodon carcharias]
MAAPSGEFNRSVLVQIANNTENKLFTSPATYIYSGYIYSKPTPLINPGMKGEALFVRTSGTARGSVGVLTYTFGHTQVSLLFSNPYDYNLYSTFFALYIPYEPEQTDENLYYKMYYELVPSCNFAKITLDSGIGEISVCGGNVVITATINAMNDSSISIVIRDKDCAGKD